jgi:NitT/TauT family transport system permease protein
MTENKTIDATSTRGRRWFPIRGQVGTITSVLLGIACIVVVFGLWWFVTAGETPEERIVSPFALPSPTEAQESFQSLWFERALTRNIFVTLKRVAPRFLLATLVGVPLGVLAGCFPPVRAFLTPLILFGRNVPLAALIPLTLFLFGIGETQKVLFIFLTCVAFIIADVATSLERISQDYLDTAYTLGSNRWQLITKVMVPLAMPSILDSLRLLFGLAFGYIMLAETIKSADEAGGIGYLIGVSQKRNSVELRAHIFLIILIIPLVAFAIDRLLFLAQRGLFPHKYGGNGWLLQIVRMASSGWGDLKSAFIKPKPPFDQLLPAGSVQDRSGESSEIRPPQRGDGPQEWRP